VTDGVFPETQAATVYNTNKWLQRARSNPIITLLEFRRVLRIYFLLASSATLHLSPTIYKILRGAMYIFAVGIRGTSNKRAIMDKPLNERLQNSARRKQRLCATLHSQTVWLNL